MGWGAGGAQLVEEGGEQGRHSSPRILLKCRFRLGTAAVGPTFCISDWLGVMSGAADPWTASGVLRGQQQVWGRSGTKWSSENEGVTIVFAQVVRDS